MIFDAVQHNRGASGPFGIGAETAPNWRKTPPELARNWRKSKVRQFNRAVIRKTNWRTPNAANKIGAQLAQRNFVFREAFRPGAGFGAGAK